MSEDKIFQRFDSIDEHLAEHDRRFDAHDNQFDFFAKKMLEHEDRLTSIEENMATKGDIREISNTLDTLVRLAQKKDQELTMVTHGMRRMQDDIERIKPLIGLT